MALSHEPKGMAAGQVTSRLYLFQNRRGLMITVCWTAWRVLLDGDTVGSGGTAFFYTIFCNGMIAFDTIIATFSYRWRS